MSIVKSKRFLSGVNIKISHNKKTSDCQTTEIPLPEKITVPMLQHMGAPCDPLVKKGDYVTVGQKIGESKEFFSVPVHASCSGQVEDIIEYVAPGGQTCKAIMIHTDSEQTVDSSIKAPVIHNVDEFIGAVKESGLIGLGGAGFPTFIKLSYKNREQVKTLVVNAAECEPYITSDYRECLENTSDIVAGIRALKKYLSLQNIYIGIEDNKPKAQEILEKAFEIKDQVSIVRLKTLYPQGAEKSIIYATTGIVVEKGKLPADCGVVVMNISSVGFLGRYLQTGIPLVTRRLTIDGDFVKNPVNVSVPIGTSVRNIMGHCGIKEEECGKILMGGPMMGLAVSDIDAPIIKNNNAITFLSEKAAKDSATTACIRCGRCIRVCPMLLMPARLEKAYDKRDLEALTALNVDLCINCGCCSYICPARRHLAQKNQLAKQLLKKRPKESETK